MSLPPYVPPTEQEFNALHERLAHALDAYSALSEAVGVKGDLCYLSNAISEAGDMKRRLDALSVAVRGL